MKVTKNDATAQQEVRPLWQKPTIRKVGSVSDVLKGGGAKLSIAGGDPGDARKPSGGE